MLRFAVYGVATARYRSEFHAALQHATIFDGHLLLGGAARRADCFDLCHHIHSIDHLSKHNMAAIKPSCLHRSYEELGAVRVRASVGHAQDARSRVLQAEVLVGKLLAVDALAACAVAAGEVPPLDHEVWDDAVELATLVVERHTTGGIAFVTRAKVHKVRNCFWNGASKQPDCNALWCLIANLHVEEDLVSDRLVFGRSRTKKERHQHSSSFHHRWTPEQKFWCPQNWP